MAISSEVRKLENKWKTNSGWPKRLEWIEIDGIHGWTGARIDFLFPIVAIVGENGAGKSTVMQAAASVYGPPPQGPEDKKTKGLFPSDFFPDTPWERIDNAAIRYSVREGPTSRADSVRKLKRWRGYSNRPKRHVEYVDLSRVQPVSARTGYLRLANPQLKEASGQALWDDERVKRLSHLLGKKYGSARMAFTELDAKRSVPVLTIDGNTVSGFHQGAGEITTAELLQTPFRKTALVVIDEIETSLHPRAQRRLVRELAEQCRLHELQIILTTHSPYILDELPPEARIQIISGSSGRTVVAGVSPEFAMTHMDEEQHPECDLYVEDERAKVMLREILVRFNGSLVNRCLIIPYGAAAVGYALGLMASQNRFPRPTCVFVDGDQEEKVGCKALPGNEAPERVVFGALEVINWDGLAQKLSRSFSQVADACARAITTANHHDWVRIAADDLLLSTDVLWQAMCAIWTDKCLNEPDARPLVESIESAIGE